MNISLIRHGMTAGNSKHQYIGRTDDPLCEDGVRRLKTFVSDPDVHRVYISPLLRTRQTAQILFPSAELIPVDGLREMDFGVFEQRSAEDMAHDADYIAWVDGGCLGRCPDGESRAEFSARSCAAFERLVGEAIARGETEIVIVAHGGTVMSLCSAYAVPHKDYFNWMTVTPNGGCWKLALDEAAWPQKKELTVVASPQMIDYNQCEKY